MKLREINIGREEIIETYKHEPRLYEEYLEIRDMLDAGVSLRQVYMDYDEAFFSKFRAYTANPDRVPRSLKGAMKLEENGMLPMDMNNPNIFLVNLLAGYSFWRGTRIAVEDKTDASNLIFIPQEEHMDDLIGELNKILRKLNCYVKQRKSRESDAIYYGTEVGRLMDCMGYPAGKKRNVVLPGYVIAAMNSLGAMDTPQREFEVAYGIVRDFVHTLIFIRGKFTSGGFRANLNSFVHEEDTREQGRLVSKMGNIAFPDIKFRQSNTTQHGDEGTYSTYVTTRPQIDREMICSSYRRRVNEVIDQIT
ncbi:hypothetical protein ACFL2V_18425 [Pseudomonadota bacterium]